MVKVTLEFQNVEETIVALGKLGGIVAAPAEKAPRKGRNDKGQPRGEYKPRVQDGAAGGASASAAPATAVVGAERGDPAAPESVPTVPPAAPAAPSSPADVVKAEIKQQQAAQGTGFPEPTVGEKDADVQAAIESLYNKFGIDRVRVVLADFGIDRARNLPKSKKADFIAAIKAIVA